ncbi:MAG: hypothetical protein MUE73_00465 [Planctomycetes bacterium]|nr:hypothetical protein [Planctomycetota bacterium]
MAYSHGKQITNASPEARFFLSPDKALHRQYEALRAYFVEDLSSPDVARRFGYSPGAFRVLCTRFRQEPEKSDRFFRAVQRGPQSSPLRDKLRETIIALRKKNLSVYDIQRELGEAGKEVSINFLAILLREEGFARLPRRRDDERPEIVRPARAAVADVRELDPSPRSFHTSFAGLFLFAHLLEGFDLGALATGADLPGSSMIPGEQALRCALALKLVGTERKSHIMSHVLDQGLALFAGLNAIPKRSWFATYSSRLGSLKLKKLMDLWFDQAQAAGVRRSGSFDLDFHSVPAHTEKEPLDTSYVSQRSRREKSVLVFLARDAEERILCYSNAAIPKSRRAGEIIEFAEFYKKRTGSYPRELVFDSQLTTYPSLDWLNKNGITFLTLRRRTRKMLSWLYSLPPSMWKKVTLEALTRKYRTPKVLEEMVGLKGYEGEVRQLSIVDLGHEEPTVLLTNNRKEGPPALITRYAHRMLIENGIAEAIHFFHLDALSSMVELKVDFDLQITLMGSTLYRMLACRLPENYQRAHAKTIFENLLAVGGKVDVGEQRVVVTLDHKAHNPILAETGLLDRPTRMPWFYGRELVLRLK